MEVYVPYIVGSSISAFLGNMAYSYIYSQSDYGVENNIKIDNNESNGEIINMNDFCLIDEKLNESEINNDNDNDRRPIGISLKDKMISLQTILKKECNREYPINNTKKVRNRWMRYIDDYQRLGHRDFVLKYKKNKL